ncbi:MAG: S41 family peptidase [Bacteroidales bacterium]|nr:S41 family peptidase [Bacteroidales bacterium]
MIRNLYLLSIIAIACATHIFAQDPQDEFSPARKLMYADYIIENFYVEDVDADSVVTEGIIAMLKTLDPHSSYSTPEETKDLNEPLEGKFSGIGVQFNMSTDTVYVIQTISGGPSEKVGIRPGDRIVAANDTVIAGKKLQNSQVLKTLRGPKGSKVKLSVLRDGEMIDFMVVRDDIPINSVDGTYMVTPEIGYISLSRFAEDSGQEVADAIEKLQGQGMKKLILDLENNGGGYLKAAHDIASLFLEPGDLIVYTKGKSTEPVYYRMEQSAPLFTGPMAVMVDQYSASAAEIVSGALQDNDRATIVGRRTFGKGLVQRPFPFPDGSMIRLTVSRYYTPTGRSIQKPYEKGKGEEYQLDLLNRYKSGELWSRDSIHFDENQVFHTLKKGRIVHGGGGIIPDEFVPVDTSYYTDYYRDLMAKGAIPQFTLNYIDHNREQLKAEYPTEDAFFATFQVSPEIIEGLVAKGQELGVGPNPEELETSRPVIEAIIKGYLTRDLYEYGTYVRATNPLNPVFLKAVEVLQNE